MGVSNCFKLKQLVDTGRCYRCGHPDLENIYEKETGDTIIICGNCGRVERIHYATWTTKYANPTEPIKV